MFYEYASATADKIDELEQQMRQMGVEPAIIYGGAAAAAAATRHSDTAESMEED